MSQRQAHPSGDSSPENDRWRAAVSDEAPRVRSLIGSRVGNSAVAEDLLQDVVAAALEKHNGHSVNDLPAWMRGLALHRVQMHYRSEYRRANRERLAARPDATETRPLDVVLTAERAGLLEDGLSQLEPDDRAILHMKYVDELSYDAIADRLDVSWNAIAHRLRRARERLKEILHGLLNDG